MAPSLPVFPTHILILLFIALHTSKASCRPLMLPQSPTSRMLVLVSTPTPALSYHGGPLLTAPRLRLHTIWYGSFSTAQQAAITNFISSFHAKGTHGIPSVSTWWKTIQYYKDSSNKAPSSRIKQGETFYDSGYSRGKKLTNADLAALVEARYAANKKTRASSIYIVFTAADVVMEDFCMSSCGMHSTAAAGKMPFIWVGNAVTQCPGMCAWPFAEPEYGPPGPPLLPPSGDIGADGMIINLATLLAGTVTNPFDSGYFEGDSSVPTEAGSACEGDFGEGSYPGYPGKLLMDQASGASFNVVGSSGHQFLLPAIWNPSNKACQTTS